MKLTEEELQRISDRLCDLATECHFMYDEAKLGSFLVGCYCHESYQVLHRLQAVLRRSDKLLNDLRCVEASLDFLLVKHQVFDD